MTINYKIKLFAFYFVVSLVHLVSSLHSHCINIQYPSESYEKNTVNIQNALNKASTQHRHRLGCVRISGGDYPVKRLFVKVSIVHVLNANNVVIDGPGVLYGNAENAWRYFSDYDNRMSPYFDDGTQERTHCLYIQNSNNVVVKNGLNLHNATDWTFRIDNSSNIFVDNVDIYGDSRFPNNDGFDPQSSINVTLINSRIDVADDGVCPKADKSMGPLTNLFVKNVTIRSKSHAIKFGSNTDTLMSNIVFDNITIWDSNGGLSIQQRSGGNIRNVTWSNIRVETRYQAGRWWGNGEWLGITNNPRNIPNVGDIKDMKFINISGRSENGGLLSGLSHGVSNILFENIDIKIMTWSNYSNGPEKCCANPPICAVDQDDNTTKCVSHPIQTGTIIECMGTRDYRPTPSFNKAEPCLVGNNVIGHGRTPSKAHGIFLENAKNVHFKGDIKFEFEVPRKSWFGNCIEKDQYSINISGLENVKCIHGSR